MELDIQGHGRTDCDFISVTPMANGWRLRGPKGTENLGLDPTPSDVERALRTMAYSLDELAALKEE
jgi:hypothetical protein